MKKERQEKRINPDTKSAFIFILIVEWDNRNAVTNTGFRLILTSHEMLG